MEEGLRQGDKNMIKPDHTGECNLLTLQSQKHRAGWLKASLPLLESPPGLLSAVWLAAVKLQKCSWVCAVGMGEGLDEQKLG